MDYNWKMVLRRDFHCYADLPSQEVKFDLRLLGGWKKIFPKNGVKNGDESHGIVGSVKRSPEKRTTT